MSAGLLHSLTNVLRFGCVLFYACFYKAVRHHCSLPYCASFMVLAHRVRSKWVLSPGGSSSLSGATISSVLSVRPAAGRLFKQLNGQCQPDRARRRSRVIFIAIASRPWRMSPALLAFHKILCSQKILIEASVAGSGVGLPYSPSSRNPRVLYYALM